MKNRNVELERISFLFVQSQDSVETVIHFDVIRFGLRMKNTPDLPRRPPRRGQPPPMAATLGHTPRKSSSPCPTRSPSPARSSRNITGGPARPRLLPPPYHPRAGFRSQRPPTCAKRPRLEGGGRVAYSQQERFCVINYERYVASYYFSRHPKIGCLLEMAEALFS